VPVLAALSLDGLRRALGNAQSARMKRMLGFCCCAATGVLAAITAATDANRPIDMVLVMGLFPPACKALDVFGHPDCDLKSLINGAKLILPLRAISWLRGPLWVDGVL
jgi:hypothetical protein